MHLDPDPDLAPSLHRHLDRLGEDLGGVDVAVDVVRAFLSEVDPRLAELERDGDENARRRVAHVLKSTAQLVGLDGLAAAALAVEVGGSDLQAVRRHARSGARELRRWLAGVRGW